MLPNKQRYALYVILLMVISVVCTSALANTKVYELISEVVSVVDTNNSTDETSKQSSTSSSLNKLTKKNKVANMAAPMFMTIIQGADDTVGCSDNGFTVARFILCGDADDRPISLSGGPYSNVSWEQLGGACTPDTNEICPNTTAGCYTQVSTSQTYNLDASAISATDGAEFRVVADGMVFYFEVTKSTIDQSYLKTDFICNNPGRIELTGLPNNYIFRIREEGNPTFGPYQSSSVFPNLLSGRYVIDTKLDIPGDVCVYTYPVIEIVEENIDINVTFTDALCAGQAGSIDVEVLPDNVGPYVFTLLDENGAEIEFTSTLASNTHTFGTVSPGTYSVKVETNECKEDIPNGIPAPIQDRDTSGNPIIIGNGLNPIDVVTNTNGESFGCATITSVDIDISITGGSSPYSYTVSDGGNSGGTFASTDTYTVTSEGTYTFSITDAAGCTATKSEYVAELDPPIVSAVGVDGTCTNGGARIEFTVTDSQGFNIEYRTDSADPWSSSQTLPVSDGTYNTIGVRYFQGGFECTLTLPSVTVTSQVSVTGAASRTQDYTCVNGGGIIDFNAGATSGGSGTGYQYSIGNGYQSGTSFTGLAPGTYVPYVRDDSGCAQPLTPIVINEPEEPSAIDFVQDQLDCATGTSRVTVNVTSGVAITQYAIISPISVTPPGNVFSGLSLDTAYQFEITDANGCVYPANFTTGGFSTIRARVKSGGDLRVCPSATDGNGAFLVDGFATDYDYTITGPAPFTTLNGTSGNLEIPIGGLGAGTYIINVTDNDTNCVNTASLVIEEAAIPLSVVANETAMSCQNNNRGRVVAAPTGGFGGYRYRLDWPSSGPQGPKSGAVFGNLTEEGLYTLTIIDAEGCEATDTFTLTEVDSPTVTFDSADYCYSPTNTASITVTSTPGSVAIVGYRIGTSGPTQASPTFTGLVPGTYIIQVVDASGCTDETAAITIPPQIQVSLDLVSEIPCGGNGEMQISINDGNISNLAATSYTIFKDGVAVPLHTGNPLLSNPFNYTIPVGEHGDYTVEVTDNNTCSDISEPLTFIAPTNIAATERIVGPSCSDPNSGFVEIIPTVTSGIPPFEVVFAPAPTPGVLVANDPINPNAGATTFAFSSQTIYSGLPAGFYEYVVKDSRNCDTGVIRIEVVADLTPAPDATITPIDAVCSLTNIVSGGVTIDNITDGSPDFTVVIEDNFGNPIYTESNVTVVSLPLNITDPLLVVGQYIVRTIDSRGCTDEDVLNIISATVDIVPDFTTLPLVCTAGGFAYCVDIVGGVGPFDIRLVETPVGSFIPLGGTPPTPNRRHCFPNVQFGESFTVEVRDNDTGCIYEEVITVPDDPTGTVNVSLAIDNATCIPGNLVELTYAVTGSTGSLAIEIINLDTGAIFISETRTETTYSYQVPEGPYSISVEDAGGCAGGATADAILNIPRVDIIENQNANCNAPGQLTVRGSGGDGGPYEYAYVPTTLPATLPTPADFTDATTVSLPGSLAPGTSYDIWVRDGRGCDFMTSAAVVQLDPALPVPIFNVDNQCDVVTPVGGFTITVEMPGNIDTPSFTLNGDTQTPVYVPGSPTIAVFNVNSIGVYRVDVIDANGCTSFAEPEVFQLLSASGGFGVDEPTCTDADGIITITVNGGSGDFDFELQDDLGNPITNQPTGIFTGIPFGNYQVLVTDNIVTGGVPAVACDFTVVGIVSSAPTSPDIQDIGQNNMSCNGVVDGSISLVLFTGTDIDGIQEYNLYTSNLASYSGTTPTATNNSGSFDLLGANTYVVEVVTDRGCTDVEEFTIVNPPAFIIDAVAGALICEPGANRFSTTEITATVTGLGNGAPYGFKLDPADSYQFTNTTSQIFEIVDTGVQQSFLVYAIDSNGCEFVIPSPIVIDTPSTVTGAISEVNAMDCEDPERITVTVTNTTNFTIEDQGSSIAFVPNVVQTSGTSVTFDLPLMAGEYRLQVNDAAGCIYPIAPYIVDSPILPNVVIDEAEPVSCFGSIDGALNINVTDFSGVYDYIIYSANDPGFAGGIFGTPVAGNSTGTIDMIADGNPFVITGLPAGNLRAVIREQGKTNIGCSVYSTVATIRSPNGPLNISDLVEIGRVGCDNNLGEITITAEGGWDSSPYQFMLEIETPLNSGNYTIHTPLGPTDNYTGLASGRYRATVEDIEGCSVSEIILLEPVPPINAEAIIIRQLECPDGNDAVIEAVEPGTTTPGAIGGVASAGYQYSLLTLNSNDNLDVASSTGLQNTPRFVGTAGTGVIEAGWYSIEVVSTLNCSYRTVPIQVIPPLPIVPRLIQTAVPACGNIATMKIELGASAEVGTTYEYRNYLSSDLWLPMTYQSGTAEELIPGVVGVSYRYEVRKVGDLSSCEPIATNGITITDADPLDLDVASPTFDVTCAYEVDGRIEAQVEGGTGIYEFRIYNADPGTDAFAAESLPTYNGRAAQATGTFEDLEEGSYWISVISRLNCGEIEGPFVIDAPEPVEIVSSNTPVSCNGETDGTITMTVTSPSAGLVKFAIEPNLSELVTDPDNPESYTFTDLAAGTYTVLSQDAEGCPQTFEIEVTEPDQLIINNLQTTPELCIGANDGTAVFTIEGGTPFNDPLISSTPYYEYKIEMTSPIDETGTGVFAPYDGSVIENLQGGATYAIFVQDANLCPANELFIVGIGVNLTAQTSVQYGCEGIFPNSTSSVLINDQSLLPNLLFYLEDMNSIDPPLTEQEMIDMADVEYTWGDLPASQYRAHIFHQNGCSISVEFEVDGYDPLTLEAIKTGPNELMASAEGGFGGYEFFFQGESTGTETVFTTNETTVVNVRVVDQNGCEAEVNIPFEFTGMIEIPNFFTPDGDTENEVWAPKNREFFPNIEVKIYDRYGRVVAELNQITSWDGTYDGNEVPTGDYWYVVNANDKSKIRYVGHFTLYR